MSEWASASGADSRRVCSISNAATASGKFPDAINAFTFASSVLQRKICDSTWCLIEISAASCTRFECFDKPWSRTGTRPDYGLY